MTGFRFSCPACDDELEPTPGLDWFCHCGATAYEDDCLTVGAKYTTLDGRLPTQVRLTVSPGGNLLVRVFGQPWQPYDKADRAETVKTLFEGLSTSYVMAL